jgi:hypothetical protein
VKSHHKQDIFCYSAFAKCFIIQHHLFSYVNRYDVSSQNIITMVWSHLYPSSQVRITLFHRKQIWDFLKSFRSIQPAVKMVAKTLLLFGTVQLGYLTPNCFWLKTNPFVCCKRLSFFSIRLFWRKEFYWCSKVQTPPIVTSGGTPQSRSFTQPSAQKSIHQMPITSNWLVKMFPMSSNIWISSISALNFNYHRLELGLAKSFF